MWILSAEGNTFQGRRLWLRPGSVHLLGRVSTRPAGGENLLYIEHKSVSRKHLILEVKDIAPGDSGRIHVRSNVTLTDNSKTGTKLNGESFQGCSRVVGEIGTRFSIKLGSSGPDLILEWIPKVMTVTGLGKGAKSQTAIASYRKGLEEADIKVVSDYVSNQTSHVVTNTRNKPACLQALTQAKWVVTEEFVDVLRRAVKRRGPDADGHPVPCDLEHDFDRGWPKEEDYIPPTAREPNPRPSNYLKPDGERAEVFKDFVFVFLAQSQYGKLLPAVTSGGGKGLCFQVTLGSTDAEEVVKFANTMAGNKDRRALKLVDQVGHGGVVIVRLEDKADGFHDWLETFLSTLQTSTGQVAIDQNEFLDAILMNDAGVLRRAYVDTSQKHGNAKQVSREAATPPSSTSDPMSRASPTQQSNEKHSGVDGARPISFSETQLLSSGLPQPPTNETRREDPAEEEQPPRKRQRRPITQSRFAGFDDFDPGQFISPATESPKAADNGSANGSEALNEEDMAVDETSQYPSNQQSRHRRRSNTADPRLDAELRMEERLRVAELLIDAPGQATQSGDRNRPERTNQSVRDVAKQQSGKGNGKKANPVVDRDAMKKRTERIDEQHEQDEENMRRKMEGVDINGLRDLAKIEEMTVPMRTPAARDGGANRDGWNPAWNGRKNFKKFRRPGERHDGPRLQRVMVSLEEVPNPTYGVVPAYWPSTISSSASGKSKSQSQSQTTLRNGRAAPFAAAANADDEDAASDFRRRIQRSREEDTYDNDNGAVDPDEIAGRPRDAELARAARETEAAASQTLHGRDGGGIMPSGRGKRPAAEQGGAGPGAKRTRPNRARLAAMEMDDDDDGLSFRRRAR